LKIFLDELIGLEKPSFKGKYKNFEQKLNKFFSLLNDVNSMVADDLVKVHMTKGRK
jgi:hypothetical protein